MVRRYPPHYAPVQRGERLDRALELAMFIAFLAVAAVAICGGLVSR